MKLLSLPLATSFATLASVARPIAAVFDLSKDLEVSPSLNKSPGALAVLAAAKADPGIRTTIVIEDGRVVASYVREGADPEDPVPVWSLSKSVTSLLYGILFDEGKLNSVNVTLGEIFTDAGDWEGIPDAEFRKAITIRDMLTMTSGLAESTFIFDADDMCENDANYWLRTPISDGKGGRFAYLPNSEILRWAFVKLAGMGPREFLADRVLAPLGIADSEIDWQFIPNSSAPTLHDCPTRPKESVMSGLHLTGPQMAKIGLLYLNGGLASPGVRVVSADYINESLTDHVHIKQYWPEWYWIPEFYPPKDGPQAFGSTTSPGGQNQFGMGHGYLWYKDEVKFEGQENWSANGNLGQRIILDRGQGRVAVQLHDDPSTWSGGFENKFSPVHIAMDPVLSFDGPDHGSAEL